MKLKEKTVSEVSLLRDQCKSRLGWLKIASELSRKSYVFAFLLWGVYAFFAFSTSPEAFARSGAGLVVTATLVSGVHLFAVDSSRATFGFMRRGGILGSGTKKGATESENKARNALFKEMWDFQLKAVEIENSLVGSVIRWEVTLATVGTIVWGYGDLVRDIVCGDRWGGCENGLF